MNQETPPKPPGRNDSLLGRIMKDMRLRVIGLIILLCTAAGAQKRPAAAKRTPAAQQAAYPVESITIEGNDVYSREQILSVAGIKPGDKVTRKDIEAARDRLTASGAFDRLEFSFSPAPGGRGYAITFKLSEAGPFYPVQFEELGIDAAAAKAALKRADPLFGERIPPTKEKIALYSEALGRETGKKITGALMPDDFGTMAVIFRPAGSLPVIARVRFAGNSVVHSSQIENAINSVAVGRPYRERRFRMMLDGTVRPIYEMRGRAGVEFTKIETEKERDVDGIVLTVTVSEGESYSLGEVRVEGMDEKAGELEKAAALKPGDVFNIEEVRAAAERVEKALRRNGHMGVRSDIIKDLDRTAKRVNVVIRVEPGPQYRFGKLAVEGLDITTEPAVRKLWGVKPGQPFNADYPDYFLGRIREEGYFDNLGKTSSKLAVDEAARTVDVTLIFKGEEKPKKPEDKKG